MKSEFERASEVPFEIPGITLVLIMASGERLLEPGVRLKTVKPKSQGDRPAEYWSPNYLRRVFRTETEDGDPENHDLTIPDWKQGGGTRTGTQ
jgi:hypothetical protein